MNFTLITLYVLHFLNDGIRTSFIALLPFIAKDMHLSLAVVGVLGASQSFLGSALSMPAGLLSSRIGGFTILFTSLLLYSLGAGIIGFAPHIAILIPIFYLAISGFGMFHSIAYALVARASDTTNKGRNMGNFTAFGDIGRSILPTIALFIVVFVGWRWTFEGIAVFGILLFFIFRYFFHYRNPLLLTKHKQKKIGDSKTWIKEAVGLLHQRDMLLITIAGVIDAFAGSSIYIFLPFFVLAKGIAPVMLGVFTGAYFVGSLAGKTILGRGVDRFGNTRIFVWTELLMSIFLLLLTAVTNSFILIIISFFLGLFTRGTTPVVGTLYSQIVHEKHYEKVFAISLTLLELSAALSAIILGVIADKFGLPIIFYLTSFLALLASLPIVAYARLKK